MRGHLAASFVEGPGKVHDRRTARAAVLSFVEGPGKVQLRFYCIFQGTSPTSVGLGEQYAVLLTLCWEEMWRCRQIGAILTGSGGFAAEPAAAPGAPQQRVWPNPSTPPEVIPELTRCCAELGANRDADLVPENRCLVEPPVGVDHEPEGEGDKPGVESARNRSVLRRHCVGVARGQGESTHAYSI